MNFIVNFKDFNPENIYLTELNHSDKNKKGNYIKLYYKLTKHVDIDLIINTPKMLIPFGLCKYEENNIRNKYKYYIDLSFVNNDNNPNIRIFYEKIKQLDNYVASLVTDTFKNDDTLKNIFNTDNNGNPYIKQIRVNKDKTNLPSTFKIKITRDDEFDVVCRQYQSNGNFITKTNCNLESIIKPNIYVSCIIKCNGVWFQNNKFGMTWKLEEINLYNT